MKRLVLILAVVSCLLVGCVTMGNKYQYSYALAGPVADPLMSYEDEKISIVFVIDEKAINFRLKNKTASVMKLIWDEASIVQFGKAQKVMHLGVKYTNRSESQPPTVVPPNAAIDDLIIPSDNIYYRQGYYSKYSSSAGGWEQHDLFQTMDLNNQEYRTTILNSKGQKFTVYLPIQHEGSTLEYTFEFVVADVKQVTQQ